MYFKIYEDKNSIGYNYYIDTSQGVDNMLTELQKESESGLFPVIEPIMMTEKEFNSLPEFYGF